MRKAFVIILAALLVLGLIVSCNDEETIDDLFSSGVTVTFNANGGTGTMATLKVRKNAETPLTANAFEKEGYVFTGWNTAADGSGTAYADKSSAKFESDTTLYAQWLQEVAITFDKNGGTGVMPVQKVGKGLATNLDANKFSHTDRYFAGWSSTAAGSVEYADKASVTLTADKTLYAIWSDKPIVTLTSGTGVSATSGSGSYAPGASVSLDATLATGYKWDKWTQTTGGADVSTSKAYTFTMGTENIAYTANAAPISYTVAFDKNGEGATGTMTSQSFTYDVAQNLSANAFSWESHAFTGWNTKADGSGTSYAAGASVSNLTSTDGDTITLYAQWSEGPNLIKSTTEAITLSSGDYTIEDTTVTVDGRITISGTVNLLLPDGMTLNASKGITVGEGNALVIDKFDSESTGTGVLNATSDVDYATGIGDDGNLETCGSITINGGTVNATGGLDAAAIGGGLETGANVTINGGTVNAHGGDYAAGIGGVMGYNDAPSVVTGGTIAINGGTVNATGGMAAAGIGGGLYAAGGVITITGGEVTATGVMGGAGIGGGYFSHGGTITISGGTVSATGGEFSAYADGIGDGLYSEDHGTIKIGAGLGLFGGADAEHSAFLSGPVESYSGDRPAYMETKATTFVTVTFDANGGEGTMADQLVLPGVAVSLNANQFEHDTLVFAGWAETADGDVVYADEASISVSADKTLYAKWTEGVQPLTLEFPTAGNVTITKYGDPGTVWYSINGAEKAEAVSDTPIAVPANGTISFHRTLGANLSMSNYFKIACSEDCYVYGNVMSLIDEDEYASATEVYEYAFFCLFDGNSHIKNHPTKELVLPATTLANYCYGYMFAGCTGLTEAPELPATAMAANCYYGMFKNAGLTTAPELPALTLAEYCYRQMFSNCSSLTTAPELPATTLAPHCYQLMFNKCIGLTTAPELSATTLTEYCYESMFYNCSSLSAAPELPAATLTPCCYMYMFYGCGNINAITCLATDISATNSTTFWVYNVSATGTFTKAPSMTGWTTGDKGIPSGWAVNDYSE